MTSAIVKRDDNGRWQKGSSGNPEGRRTELAVREVVQLARTATQDAIGTLHEIATDTGAPAMARVRASEALLARGWGSPSSEVDLDLADRAATEELEPVEFVWRMGDTELLAAEDGEYDELPAVWRIVSRRLPSAGRGPG
jgi:hypothetical protein